MKKLFLISLLTLMSFLGYSQIDTWKEVPKSNLVTQHDWITEQVGEYGSFWWLVRRTPNTNIEGWYGYYINVFSNSHLYSNGSTYKATSYIENINITMYEYRWSYFPTYGKYDWELYNTYTWSDTYKICDYEETNVARFWSYSQYCVFKVTYSKVSPYDYSNK